MDDILCNATIRFAEGSYVTLSFVNGTAGVGDKIGTFVFTDETGDTFTYQITLEESDDGGDDGGGGHN